MDARAVLSKKRAGLELERVEIEGFVGAYARGELADYFASAFLMAVFVRGMSARETADLARAMLESGERWSFELGRPTADKHSTGGVGDKVSIPLAPAVAACGVAVPMVSGRGLGHTGGTLDKLEAIAGFRTGLSRAEFERALRRTGVAFGAQTEELVPADRKLYALRDVTGLIESVPLIASSIMSKKLAEGIGALVLDVKHGSGAFLPEKERGAELARAMLAIAKSFGLRAIAFPTYMGRPLGDTAGHELEIGESLECLRGRGPADLRELVCAFGGAMLQLAGAAATEADGRVRIARALDDGSALAVFERVVEEQGGDPKALARWPDPAWKRERAPIAAPRAGWLRWTDVRALGWAIVDLGGGRRALGDRIDPFPGLVFPVREGARVERDQPVLEVQVRGARASEAVLARLRGAFAIEEQPFEPEPLVGAALEA
ncbi:MAG: thymidine phosphorylase [Planctomycetota bacterium]|nr:MAG: thymidine phosphorylase [Planctomycetota bacterium]